MEGGSRRTHGQDEGRFASNVDEGGRRARPLVLHLQYLLSAHISADGDPPRVSPLSHTAKRSANDGRPNVVLLAAPALSLSPLPSARLANEGRAAGRAGGRWDARRPRGARRGEAALCRRRLPLARSLPRPAFPARAAGEERAPVGFAGPDFLSGISPSIAELLPLAPLPNHHWPPNPSLDSHWPPPPSLYPRRRLVQLCCER